MRAESVRARARPVRRREGCRHGQAEREGQGGFHECSIGDWAECRTRRDECRLAHHAESRAIAKDARVFACGEKPASLFWVTAGGTAAGPLKTWAGALGMTHEHLYRTLSTLHREGRIRRSAHAITLA
ncbi:MAG: hypothetical protein ACYC02_04580 [Thiobacillus sp.]